MLIWLIKIVSRQNLSTDTYSSYASLLEKFIMDFLLWHSMFYLLILTTTRVVLPEILVGISKALACRLINKLQMQTISQNSKGTGIQGYQTYRDKEVL